MSRFIEVLVAIILFAAVEDVSAGPIGDKEVVLESDPCDFYSYVCVDDYLMKERIQHKERISEDPRFLLEKYLSTASNQSDAAIKYTEWRRQCWKPVADDRKNFIRRFNFPGSIGGWPALETNWTGKKFNLQNVIAEFGSYRIPIIFRLTLDADPKTFGSRILIETMENTQLRLESIRSSIKATLSPIIDNIDEVISDSAIVENWYETASNNDDYYNPLETDFKGLKSALPNINWDKQVEAVFDHQIPEDFPVHIEEYDLLKEVLSQAFQAEPKIIANYILYRFATDLPELNYFEVNNVFKNVVFQMLAKQSYKSLEKVDELRGMLHATLKNLHKVEMLFNNEEEDEIEAKIASYIKDTIPTTADTYYDDVYKQFEITPNDCYSDLMKLKKILTKLENEKMWKFGPLRIVQAGILDSFVNKLPRVANSSSAYKFQALIWFPLKVFIRTQEGLYNHKLLKDCESPAKEEFQAKNYMDYLGIPLFVQSYFDWVKQNGNLVELETEKFGINSKASLMVQLMLSQCDKNIEESVASKLSWYFTNMKEFQDTFNCPSKVDSVLEHKCFNNATKMF